jgi:hypothetical protein
MITHTLSGFANTPGDLIVQMSPRIAELPMCHTTRKAGVQLTRNNIRVEHEED